MIDTISNTNSFSVVWQYIGPLFGVGFGYLLSIKVWDRQKQWEMKRDAVSDSWRALCELEASLLDLGSDLLHPFPAQEKFKASFTKCLHAKDFAYLVVGKELPTRLTAYLDQANDIAQHIQRNRGYFTPERRKELAEKCKEIHQHARKELQIRNTD